MTIVHVIGLGIGQHELPKTIRDHILNADVLVGGQRLLDRFKTYKGKKTVIKGPIKDLINRIKDELESGRTVTVLADGDPLFFGIGKQLVNLIDANRIVFHPAVTTLQTAAAREKLSWEDIKTVSLHGRDNLLPLLQALISHDMVGVYTDNIFTPSRIAQKLIKTGIDIFSMTVFENIGERNEKISNLSLSEAAQKDFSPLNFILLRRTGHPEIPLKIGIDDDLYIHQKGLITKKEVRAVGLAMLSIEDHHVVWDLGAGCGSVGIEASLLSRRGMVISVEKDIKRCETIRKNIKKTGAWTVSVVNSTMPEGLDRLPEPDRIFIGGGLKNDIKILEKAASLLKTGGRLVIHTILLKSLNQASSFFEKMSWPYSITEVTASRSQKLAGEFYLRSLNPVFIVTASKINGH